MMILNLTANFNLFCLNRLFGHYRSAGSAGAILVRLEIVERGDGLLADDGDKHRIDRQQGQHDQPAWRARYHENGAQHGNAYGTNDHTCRCGQVQQAICDALRLAEFPERIPAGHTGKDGVDGQ